MDAILAQMLDGDGKQKIIARHHGADVMAVFPELPKTRKHATFNDMSPIELPKLHDTLENLVFTKKKIQCRKSEVCLAIFFFYFFFFKSEGQGGINSFDFSSINIR